MLTSQRRKMALLCHARLRQRKRCTSLLIIFIKDTFSKSVRGTVVPTRIIRVRINTHSHNDACADIRAAPFASTGEKLASNEKITVFHASRYEIVHGHRDKRERSRKQDVKSFLRE